MNETLIVRTPYMDPQSRSTLATRYKTHFSPPDDLLLSVAGSVRAMVTDGHTGADAAFMDRLPNLRLIACYGAGYDGIDVAAAHARNIAVTNTPDVLTDEVANFTIGMIVAAARRFLAADRFVRDKSWLKGSYPLTRPTSGATVGIFGFGRIGQAVAKRCDAMDMSVLYSSARRRPQSSYEFVPTAAELARRSDFLVVCCALNTATHHIVDAEVIRALGPEGILINVARGPVVDEAALILALELGEIGGAALDVFEIEPSAPPALCARDDVLLLPHMASGTAATRAAIGRLVLNNLEAFYHDRPLLTPVE